MRFWGAKPIEKVGYALKSSAESDFGMFGSRPPGRQVLSLTALSATSGWPGQGDFVTSFCGGGSHAQETSDWAAIHHQRFSEAISRPATFLLPGWVGAVSDLVADVGQPAPGFKDCNCGKISATPRRRATSRPIVSVWQAGKTDCTVRT